MSKGKEYSEKFVVKQSLYPLPLISKAFDCFDNLFITDVAFNDSHS